MSGLIYLFKYINYHYEEIHTQIISQPLEHIFREKNKIKEMNEVKIKNEMKCVTNICYILER